MKHLKFLLIISILSICFISIDKPSGLSVGDLAPDFNAKNQNKQNVYLKLGSVVLLFYRGEWCPYCNRQLKALEDSLSLIRARGALISAVSPEKLENVSKTIEKTKATYDIVTDENLQILSAYKVAFELDEKTSEKLKSYGISLLEKIGSNGNNLPVPAVDIINREGKITYRYFDSDYKKRASVQEILKKL